MLSWSSQSPSQKIRLDAILLLFRRHPHLRSFLFSGHEALLRLTPEFLLKQAQEFCRGEQLLISVALDIWSRSGFTSLSDVLDGLDEQNFVAVLQAFMASKNLTIHDVASEKATFYQIAFAAWIDH